MDGTLSGVGARVWHPRTAQLVGSLILAAALLTGCGTAPAAEPLHAWGAGSIGNGGGPGCPVLPPPVAMPGDLAPDAAVECSVRTELVQANGEWELEVRRRTTTGLPALVAALRLPSLPAAGGTCPTGAVMLTSVTLEVAARTVVVAVPRDACGVARPEVIRAYRELSWLTVSRIPLRLLRPEAAVKAGCERGKDLLASGSMSGDVRTGSFGDVLTGVRTVAVCRYRSDSPAGRSAVDGTAESADGTPESVDGTPESGGTLGPAESAEVVRALSAAGPAAACTRRHQHFAVLRSGQGAEIYVELDGCLRILTPDGGLRQANPRLVTLLGG